MTPDVHISPMLAVQDAPAAVDWYKRALGATELRNLGGVAGLSIAGAPVFVGEPENNGWDAPAVAGTRTVRVEVFTDHPDGSTERAVAAGADGSIDQIRDHQAPWGIHRQAGFTDPFGHLRLVRGQVTPATLSWLADPCQHPAGQISADSPAGEGMESDLIYLTRNEPHQQVRQSSAPTSSRAPVNRHENTRTFNIERPDSGHPFSEDMHIHPGKPTPDDIFGVLRQVLGTVGA